MYDAFYGLSEKPFNLTPDPRFLYLSEKHKEAFAHLLYGIKSRTGFAMISGEIGTGKTTICRSLLGQLDSDTEVAFIFNPMLSPKELLSKINEEFGIESQADTIKDLIDELNEYLLSRTHEGKNCVLVIDEAQDLEPQVLEQIRLLSNLETEKQKLLQIMLLGQPELAQMLELPELRQLNQRITARYHLKALDHNETLHYIAYRLRVAGGRKKVRFTRSAVRLIYKYSGGTPRVINAICDRALLIGYTKETREIGRSIIRQATREIRGEKIRQAKSDPLRRALVTRFMLSSAVALFVVIVLFPSLPVTTLRWTLNLLEGTDHSAEAIESPIAMQQETDPVKEARVRSIEVAPEPARIEFPEPEAVAPETVEAPEDIETIEETVVSFRAMIDNMDPVESLGGALTALLHAWDMPMVTELPSRESVQSIRSFAQANAVALEQFKPSFRQIVNINLPVLIRLRTGSVDKWIAVVGFEPGVVSVSDTEGATASYSQGDVEDAYNGDAVFLWIDAKPRSSMLNSTDHGGEVMQLQDDLRALGLWDRISNGLYDGETLNIIMRLQQAAGILVDGIVGPQTRMVLTSWLDKIDTPTLQQGAYEARIRRVVLQVPYTLTSLLEARPIQYALPTTPFQPPLPLSALSFDSEIAGPDAENDAPSIDTLAEENPLPVEISQFDDTKDAQGKVVVMELNAPEAEAVAPPALLPAPDDSEFSVTPPSASNTPLVPREAEPEIAPTGEVSQ